VVGDAYAVLPFGNSAVTRTVTGQQLWAMMEHSVEALPAANGWFGQVPQ
jgi:5'-nucleotidase